MNIRELNKICDLVAAEDIPKNEFDSKREYVSIKTGFYAKITPKSASSLDRNISSSGANAVTHIIKTRYIEKIETGAWITHPCTSRWFRVLSWTVGAEQRFVDINVNLRMKATIQEATKQVYYAPSYI